MNNTLSISDTKALFDYCLWKANLLRATAENHNLVTERAKMKKMAAALEQRAQKLEQILHANVQTLTFQEPPGPGANGGKSGMRKV